MPLPFSSAPDSLCLLRLSAVGDVCHTVPVLRTIQSHWPGTRITWVIGRLEASLVGDIPGVEFIIFDKSKGWRAFGALRRAMRGRRFDALLHMQVSIRASLASRLIPADIRLGFDRSRAKDLQWLFTNARIAPVERQHVMDGLFGFAEALGITERVLRWDIPIPATSRSFVDQAVSGKRNILVISPCSSARFRNWRNWSVERYAQVADYAAEHHGLHVVLTGGPSALERDYGENIVALAKHKPLNFIGQTTLKQLLAVIDHALAIITPDSGPAHMATAVGTPVIGLYASSNPARTGPYLSRPWVVDKYPEALQAECGKSADEVSWGRRVRNPAAMELINVTDVTARLDELVGN